MSCILRVSGKNLEIGPLLRQLPFAPYRIWCKGSVDEIRKKVSVDSGAAFEISGADLDEFDLQIEDATAFLEKHGASLKAMAEFPGVEYAVLDFGIEVRDEYVVYSDCLPATFIQAAATSDVSKKMKRRRRANQSIKSTPESTLCQYLSPAAVNLSYHNN